MGVLWIIFCSTTDKKKSKETIIKFYFQSWIFIKFIQKKKKKIPLFKHEKTKQKSVINKRGKKNK